MYSFFLQIVFTCIHWQITLCINIYFSLTNMTCEIACHKQNVPPQSFLISNSKFFYHQLPFSFYLFLPSNINSRWMFHKYESLHLFPISHLHFPDEHFKLIFIITLPRYIFQILKIYINDLFSVSHLYLPDEYFRMWHSQ